jgi:hypothetical protein
MQLAAAPDADDAIRMAQISLPFDAPRANKDSEMVYVIFGAITTAQQSGSRRARADRRTAAPFVRWSGVSTRSRAASARSCSLM